LAVVISAYESSLLGDWPRWWAAALTILIAVALVDLLEGVRSLLRAPGLAPATLGGTLAAIALCVPEVNQIALAAMLLGFVMLLEVLGRRQLAIGWYAVGAAAVLWAGMFGATGRQSALVGALFAWWAVALVPLVHAVVPIRSVLTAAVVGAIGVLAAIVMARTGGIADSGTAAFVAAVASAVMSFAAAVAMVGLLGRNRSGPTLNATP